VTIECSTQAASAAPAQRRSKPLLPIRGVISLVDKNEDQVLRLIEDGTLEWAWDVALDPKRGRNRELRVLPACVADYLRGQACSLEWADVLRLLLPRDGPEILSKEITCVLNISSTHTYHLARRKLIVACSTWRRGRGGCARFTAKSFIEFLRDRRVL
jgi:hypothetical protein